MDLDNLDVVEKIIFQRFIPREEEEGGGEGREEINRGESKPVCT